MPLFFTAPLMLLALAILPAIWLLLRLTPPKPRRETFPPLRLLLSFVNREETPARSPWWLTLLRLAVAALIIVALAGPVWQPTTPSAAPGGTVWVLLDNGWASAPVFETMRAAAEQAIDEAHNAGVPVLLAGTADGPDQLLVPASARAARDQLSAMTPRPWPKEPGELTTALRQTAQADAPHRIVWLSDDLAAPSSEQFQIDLAQMAPAAQIIVFSGLVTPLGLADTNNAADALTVRAVRRDAGRNETVRLDAFDRRGLALGTTIAQFDAKDRTTTARFELPVEIRNDVTRITVRGVESAGATRLLDNRSLRRVPGAPPQ